MINKRDLNADSKYSQTI